MVVGVLTAAPEFPKQIYDDVPRRCLGTPLDATRRGAGGLIVQSAGQSETHRAGTGIPRYIFNGQGQGCSSLGAFVPQANAYTPSDIHEGGIRIGLSIETEGGK
jgi:hypothetical protein